MANQDLSERISEAQSLSPAARTATANGTGVDLTDYEGAVVLFNVGTITDGTHTPSVGESDDNSTFTTVAAGDLQGTFANLASNVPQSVGYRGQKRFIRATSTVAGATTGGVYGATVIRGNAKRMPI